MKFFMILKDSFREAVDGFVIYVMVILSTLLIVLVGCIGYEPVEAQLAFDSMLRSSRFVNSDRGRSAFRAFPMFGVSFKIQDLQKLNDASQPQEGDYKMRLVIADSTLGMQPPDAKEKKTDKTDSQFYQAVAFWNHTPDGNSMSLPDANAVSDAIVFDFLKDMFETHGNVNVSEVTRLPDEGRNNYVFQITTKGRKGVRGWLHRPNLFFGAIEVPIEFSLGRMVYFLQDQLVNGLGAWISLLVAVIFTAFFIPNMMRKGAVDLLLSKPIHRVSLLIFKYLGGLMFVFLNTAYAVGGVWLVMGLARLCHEWPNAGKYTVTVVCMSACLGLTTSIRRFADMRTLGFDSNNQVLEDFKRLSNWLRQHSRTGDLVISDNPDATYIWTGLKGIDLYADRLFLLLPDREQPTGLFPVSPDDLKLDRFVISHSWWPGLTPEDVARMKGVHGLPVASFGPFRVYDLKPS